MSLFSIFYYLLSVALFIVALPLLILLSFKKKYRESIPARFFLFKNPPFHQSDALWFHICSFGESRALKPIVEALETENILISTITHTGYDEAKKYNAEVRYLPYEMYLPFWIKRERVLVVLEAEFWYLLFRVATARGAKIVLLNARIADNSVDKYLKFAWFYKKMLASVEMIYAQSEVDKNRFLALGAKNIEVIGNIKLAGEIKKTKSYEKPQDCELIVAGSTHPDEEEAVLKAFVAYKKTNPKARLLIVPRHPERFGAVYELMQQYAKVNVFSLEKFSLTQRLASDLILVDMMGELNNIYAVSDIAILGGAFRSDVGGHNPLEPAFFGCKIITGKHFFHQKELFKYVHHVQYVEPDAIATALEKTKELPSSMVEEAIDLEPVVQKIKQYMK
ncbi:Lipid IVA 3-deoxy-D-manno-octulosonic acid transferase [often with also] [hydrothermal vent metagenome]|uniref:Lipid IVA 3-deoxy-D-manno-octulosonic acid transferase [often with also] n=1 Tax=hydrothermal vent metagenome TaxID=652676 RepID=A0A1W1CKK8_9ZZZZ